MEEAEAAPAKKKDEKKEKSSSSDSDSSSSSSDDDDDDKKAAPAAKAKEAAKKSDSSDSDDSSSDSDSSGDDDDADPIAAKAKAKADAKKEDSTTSDSSDDDEEETAAPSSGTKRKAEDTSSSSSSSKKPATNGSGGSSENSSVFVRGLPWKATEEEVRDFFKGCGDGCRTLDMPLDHSGRSSGTAIIDFGTDSAAAAALELDGATFGERWLSVKLSSVSTKPEGCTTVFVGNLSFDVDEDAVRGVFSPCGEIKDIRFSMDRETGEFKGFGHVEFYEESGAEAAVKLVGQPLLDRALRVDYARQKPRMSFGGDEGGGGGRGGGRGGGYVVVVADVVIAVCSDLCF